MARAVSRYTAGRLATHRRQDSFSRQLRILRLRGGSRPRERRPALSIGAVKARRDDIPSSERTGACYGIERAPVGEVDDELSWPENSLKVAPPLTRLVHTR